MRTDSTRVSTMPSTRYASSLRERFGKRVYCPRLLTSTNARRTCRMRTKPSVLVPRFVRPRVANFLAEDELKLYRLIWMRFIASQMTPAVFDQTTIEVTAKGKDDNEYRFRATGSVPKFDGFLAVYEEGKDQKDEDDEELKHRLPAVVEGEVLKFRSFEPEQHFTEPPPRLNEATLVKELEANGVGPPVHLCRNSVYDSGTRIREEGGWTISSRPNSEGRCRSAGGKLQSHLRHPIHGADGRGTRRDRRRQTRLARCDAGVLRAAQAGSRACRAEHDRHQTHGEAHRSRMREMWQTDGDQMGSAMAAL